MDHVDIVLNEANNVIPCEILNAVFSDPELSTREKMKLEIWDKIVLLDLDIYGGEKIEVDLTGLPYTQHEFNAKLYRSYVVPRELTNNKVITSILNISHMPPVISPYQTGIGYQFNSPANNKIQRRFGALDSSQAYYIKEIKLIGVNMFSAHFHTLIYFPDNWKMECIVQNDKTLNNVDIKTMTYVTELFVTAVKRYIFKMLYIKTGAAQAFGGHEISEFKEIVESYRDAEERYMELREEIGTFAMMADPRDRLDMFKLTLGSW